MFDLSRIGESIAGLLGGSAAGGADGVLGMLESAGIDPSALEGLAPQEIVDVLAANGIDLQQLAPEQLQELSSLIGGVPLAGLGEIADRFLSR